MKQEPIKHTQYFHKHPTFRNIFDTLFGGICAISACFGLISLIFLLVKVIGEALPWLDWHFITSSPSRFAEKAGIFPLIMGSLFLVIVVVILAVPLGVCASIYLEEYSPKNTLTKIIETNISNLAGVPSIVFGLLGLSVFIGFFGLKPGIIIVGAATLTLRILPTIIISTQESIRAVPNSYREAAYGLGASHWETIRTIVLPQSLPGIMTGVILATSNAIGESAPLIMIGVATSIFKAPDGLFSAFGALPLQIFAWSDYPKPEFQHGITPAAIVVLLIILVLLNLTAIIIRKKFKSKRY